MLCVVYVMVWGACGVVHYIGGVLYCGRCVVCCMLCCMIWCVLCDVGCVVHDVLRVV